MSKEELNQQLSNALKTGDLQAVKDAIEKGADVNAKSDDGGTALQYAKEEGHTEIVDLLKEAMKKK